LQFLCRSTGFPFGRFCVWINHVRVTLAQDSTLPFSEAEVEESGTPMVLAFSLRQTESLPFSEAEVGESRTPTVPDFNLAQTEPLPFSEAEVEESGTQTVMDSSLALPSLAETVKARPPC
jgi:hypothetical protein